MFDAQRVDTLLDEAVQERGYKDYRPLIEIEYLRQSSRPEPMWRVTLRCIVGGYQQKVSPQPVVATGADLNSAFRLLERQFAASSGKPQGPTPQADFSSHRRSSVSTCFSFFFSFSVCDLLNVIFVDCERSAVERGAPTTAVCT